VLITGKSVTGKFAGFFFTVTGKFKGFKLDHFTIFYLKLARKSVIFTPNLQVFFNPSNVLTNFFKTAI
jgi:hypothetical protein